MFLKVVFKKGSSAGEYTSHYRMVQSYRLGDTVRHETLLHLGNLSSLPSLEQKKLLGIRINELAKQARTGIKSLFVPEEAVESLAQSFYAQLQEKQKVETSDTKIQRIDIDSVRSQWKAIVRVMNTQKSGTTKMENEDGQEIIIRRCTEPTEKVKQVYDALKYRHRPYCQKKFVVPQTKLKNLEIVENTRFRSG